ncbi:hypothetical protein [Microvirga pakistanensis]|uniref:hypothetical protein n=1 Tax=Microvirga pakistanensis TaxID=1682650 RepID=UPI00106AEF92|nr:hypothetical protein [Microvirga pakistanensis]
MCLNSRFMLDLRHYQADDGPGLTLHALSTVQARWDRFTIVEMTGIRTTSELIEKVEESYALSHEQATRDVEFWALDKQL